MSGDASTRPNPRDVLMDVWGYDAFRPLQEESIACVMAGRDSVTVLPTGGGKSLCFQVPALCRDGMAVVVSPLISLMKDQVDGLRACGVSAAFINSTQSMDEKREVAELIRDRTLKLLYVAPERLLVPKTLDFLRQQNVSFFAVDEAHCISNWGHDFRPEYRGLKRLKSLFPDASVHAYTATASGPVRDDIAAELGLRNPETIVGDFDRPNLTYRMIRSDGRLNQVMEVVARHHGESGVIYCISRKEVEKTAAALVSSGVSALPYHAGLDDAVRRDNQDAFINDRCDVIVATVAFGMGIDKSNVRFVIHAGMPKSIEHYQQESGRAGRDGLESECVLLYSAGDVMTWKRILDGEPSSAKAAAALLGAMYDVCAGTVCRHRSLVEYFGQSYATDNCGACDVCLDEVDLVDDPITLSQKILSCVVRLDQRFGVAHTAKVLCGSGEQRIVQLGHNQLSTFGLLSAEGLSATKLWIDQLIQQGFLCRVGEYQTLAMTDAGWRLLRRDGEPRLSKPAKSAKAPKPAALAKTKADDWQDVDRNLFEVLRSLRKNIATEQNVPAYVIFGDATLRELARHRPTSLDRFATIKGVGERKLNDLGEIFVEAIAAYVDEVGVAG
jgi:ATP-dependent DNA helicase RecQ